MDQFTLVFRTGGAALLPEGVYSLTAETGEVFELFLQPAGDTRSCAAVFNLLRPLTIASCAPPAGPPQLLTSVGSADGFLAGLERAAQ